MRNIRRIRLQLLTPATHTTTTELKECTNTEINKGKYYQPILTTTYIMGFFKGAG